jgi:hypothetical protein
MGRPVEIDVALLERMWREGETAQAIAAELGCAVCQVFYWRRKLNLPNHPHRGRIPGTRIRRATATPMPAVAVCRKCGFRMGKEGHPRCGISRDSQAVPSFPLYPQKAS